MTLVLQVTGFRISISNRRSEVNIFNTDFKVFEKDVGWHTIGGVTVTESYGFSKFDVIFGYIARPTIFHDLLDVVSLVTVIEETTFIRERMMTRI